MGGKKKEGKKEIKISPEQGWKSMCMFTTSLAMLDHDINCCLIYFKPNMNSVQTGNVIFPCQLYTGRH